MKENRAQSQTSVELSELLESAVISGLPNDRFLVNMTPRKRREMVYHVKGTTRSMKIDLEVHGSGTMRAYVNSVCTIIEDGDIDHHEGRQAISWIDTGDPVLFRTRLTRHHLATMPDAANVMSAFIESIGLHTHANCPGGYRQWQAAVQLYADYIGRNLSAPVEIVCRLPYLQPAMIEIPLDEAERTKARYDIHDISDPDSPKAIDGYKDELISIEERMSPEAMRLRLILPSHLVRQRHTEIFHSRVPTS